MSHMCQTHSGICDSSYRLKTKRFANSGAVALQIAMTSLQERIHGFPLENITISTFSFEPFGSYYRHVADS
jgi:hypothetical protein